MERVRLEFPEADLVHRHPLTVRITDMNYGRHLGHDALASLGLGEGDLVGHASVVADLAMQFQAEARWPDALVVETASGRPAVVPEAVSRAIVRRGGV